MKELSPAEFEAWAAVWQMADAVVRVRNGNLRTRFGIWAVALYTIARVPAEEARTRLYAATDAEYFA